jgi:hypothetical protein
MADFFGNLMQAPRANQARMQSTMMRKRGVHVPEKLVHPSERKKEPEKRVRSSGRGVHDKVHDNMEGWAGGCSGRAGGLCVLKV